MVELTIERLGLYGDGVAPGPVYVTGALPGEVVEGEVTGDRMTAPKILTPSEHRVRPPCRHARSCGGCALQHAADEFVADWKMGVVGTALQAKGIAAEVAGIHTSPSQSRRRATLSGRRTKKGALVGFHARASDTIVEIPDCQLLSPEIMTALPALQALVISGASRKGELSLTVTASADGPDVYVAGGKPLDGPLRIELAQISGAHGLARLTWDDEQIIQTAPPTQPFGKARVAPPPGAFLQATGDGERALWKAVQPALTGAAQVVDLFAGCGTFALRAAENAEVHAVEGDKAMLSALDRGWREAQGLRRVTTEARDMFRAPLMPDELRRYGAAIIDPPRAGAEAQVAHLAGSDIGRIAMVSCNPVTFARDVKGLVGAGFTLGPVTVVDQFRWSTHVEVAAVLTR